MNRKTAVGISVQICNGGLNMVRRPDYGTTLVMFKGKKPLYGFRIKLKIVPYKYHSDPLKNKEAHELIERANKLCENSKKINNRDQ